MGTSIALFDARVAKKVLHMQEVRTVKTQFSPENAHYIGVLDAFGGLDLHDVRNFSAGPVVIYN